MTKSERPNPNLPNFRLWVLFGFGNSQAKTFGFGREYIVNLADWPDKPVRNIVIIQVQ